MSTWIGLLDAVDERLLRAVVVRRRRALDILMRGVTRLADPATAIPVAAALALGAIPSLTEAGRVGFGALVLSHLLVQILKRSVTRPRPRLPVGIQSLIRTPECFSFPSGHAAAGLSIWLPVALALPGTVGVAVMGLSLLVGLSRCYLGVHYPGDVAAGWLLALLSMIPFARPEMVAVLVP